MGENPLPPVQPSVDHDDSDALNRIPVAGLSDTQTNYPLETLEVKTEGPQSGVAGSPQVQSFAGGDALRSVPFSRRKAATVSLIITMMIVLLTGGVLAVLVKGRLAEKETTGRDVPTQGVTLTEGTVPEDTIELKKEQPSLLVSGDIITRGELQVSSGGGFVTVLKGEEPSANQTLTLPDTSGEICTSSNNCGFATQGALGTVQAQVVAATTVNGQSGDVVLQGTINQVSVATSGNTVTFTTPQNIHTAASVQFAQLQLSGALRVNSITPVISGGNFVINAAGGGITFVDGNRTFAFPVGGLASQTICTTQNNCNYGSGNGDIVNGGQIGPIIIGTNDTSTLTFETNDTQRIVLQANGNVAIDTTTLSVDAVNNRVGIGTAAPTVKLEVVGGSMLLQGTHTGNVDVSVTGSGTRMFFDVGRSAFRAGDAIGNSWDPNWVGLYSAAFGQNTRAGQWGFAAGQSTRAGTQAVAFGASSQATGWQSSAFGASTRANGQHSMATGVCNVDRADLPSTPTAADALFMIGNGTDSGLGDGSCATRSDAFTVLRNGSTTVNGGSLLVRGTHGGGNGITVTGAGTRMFFDVNKSAFRAGYIGGSGWDDASVGQYSFAAGNQARASGVGSIALGGELHASGNYSAAFGWGSTVNNSYAFTAGYDNQSVGQASQTFGYGVQMNAFAGTALGHCSSSAGGQNANTFVSTDQLFIVGNGVYDTGISDCSSRQNALEMTKNGNLAVDTNTLFVDAVNNRVGIGTNAPAVALDVVGDGIFSDRLQVGPSALVGTISQCLLTLGMGPCDIALDVANAATGNDHSRGGRVANSVAAASASSREHLGLEVNLGLSGAQDYTSSATSLRVTASSSTSGTVTGLMGGAFNVNTLLGTTITTATALHASINGFGGSIGTAHGLQVTNPAGLTSLTNNYGIRVENQTAGTNDYGIYVAGADTYALWVDDGSTRLDGTLQVAEHAAIGNTSYIDGSTLTGGGLFNTSDMSSVLVVAEDISDFSKSTVGGIVSILQAAPTAAYTGGITGMIADITVGGNQSVDGVGGAGAVITTTDSVELAQIVGNINIINLNSSGDVTNSVQLETNQLNMQADISGQVFGSTTQVTTASVGGGATAGLYQLSVAGDSPFAIGLEVSNSVGGGNITDQIGASISLQSSVGATIATVVGLDIAETTHLGNVTDSYGLRLGSVSGATNNYGIYVAGADTYALWVDDGATRLDGTLAVGASQQMQVSASGELSLAVSSYGALGVGSLLGQSIFAVNTIDQEVSLRSTQADLGTDMKNSTALKLAGSYYDGSTHFNDFALQTIISGTTASDYRLAVTNTADAEVFTIGSAGNIGINNTGTPNKLSLNTLVIADASAQLAVATAGTNNKGVIVQGVNGQTADLFQAQDHTGAVLASISEGGDLEVVNATVNGTLTVNGNATINGHVISGNSSGSTGVTAGAAAGTGATASISGNDTAGTITVDTGTAATTGSLVTVTFAQAFGNAPRVVVTAADSDGATLGYFVASATTAGFTIDVSSTPADTTEILYNYHVIE